MQDTNQILIKIEGSPYYVVQPPLYDWGHVDMQAYIKHTTDIFLGNYANNSIEPEFSGPKLLEPWRYQLASELNAKYNEDNNIDPFDDMERFSEEDK